MFSSKTKKIIILAWILVAAPTMVYTFPFCRYYWLKKEPLDWEHWRHALKVFTPGSHPYEDWKKYINDYKQEINDYINDSAEYGIKHPSLSSEEAAKKYQEEYPEVFKSAKETFKLLDMIELNPRQTFKGAVKEWKLFVKGLGWFEFVATAIVSVMFLAFIYNMRKLLVVLWILIVMPGMFIVFSDWQWLDPFKITAIFTIIYFAIVYLMPGKSRKQNHQEMKESASGDLKVVKNSELIKKVVNGERYVIQQKGKPRAAVVSMEDLKKLEEIENEIEVRSRKSTMADTGKNTSSRKPLDNREK